MSASTFSRFRSATAGGLLPAALAALVACGSDGTVTPPPPPGLVVTISAPTSGAILNDSLTLTASASAPTGIAGVQFKLDGANLGVEVSTPPYALRIDSYTFADGPHTVSARARDSVGQTALSPAVAVTIQNPRPNDIVLILSDDQRYDLMGYMPLTDAALTAETVRFDQAVVTTSLCCPSRSSILTGRYAHNHGVLTNALPNGGASKFDPSSTIATWLTQAGYRTALLGKYLNDYQRISPAVPPGWAEFEAFVPPEFYNYSLNVNGTLTAYGAAPADYSTDVLTAKAEQFIGSTNPRQGLFLYLTPYAPHAPATPAPGDVGAFNGVAPWRPSSFDEADVSDKPAWIQALPRLTQARVAAGDSLRQRQLESLLAVDRMVSRVVAALKQSGRWPHTLFVFSSDNGYSWGEHRWLDAKSCPYQECIRVPLWIRAPGLSARHDTSLAANIDLAPTFAAWTGISAPANVNGVSLLPLLIDPATPWRSAILVEHLGTPTPGHIDSQGVRTSRYLYNEYVNGDRELYDLQLDPFELTNVVNDPAYAATVATLQATLATLKAS
ncbi:MAG: sulfatase-like hydrolase/transferase [Gemmatimonadota bacterium]|nr:sulfatase-like hydrolase/transferase [Gemmatimonadota bacterium]